jgi:hypothetical protein
MFDALTFDPLATSLLRVLKFNDVSSHKIPKEFRDVYDRMSGYQLKSSNAVEKHAPMSRFNLAASRGHDPRSLWKVKNHCKPSEIVGDIPRPGREAIQSPLSGMFPLLKFVPGCRTRMSAVVGSLHNIISSLYLLTPSYGGMDLRNAVLRQSTWCSEFGKYLSPAELAMIDPLCDKINSDWNLEGNDKFRPDRRGYRMQTALTSAMIKQKYDVTEFDQECAWFCAIVRQLRYNPFGTATFQETLTRLSEETNMSIPAVKVVLRSCMWQRAQFSPKLMTKSAEKHGVTVEQLRSAFYHPSIIRLRKAVKTMFSVVQPDAFGNPIVVRGTNDLYRWLTSYELDANMKFLEFTSPNQRFLIRDDAVFVEVAATKLHAEWNKQNPWCQFKKAEHAMKEEFTGMMTNMKFIAENINIIPVDHGGGMSVNDLDFLQSL